MAHWLTGRARPPDLRKPSFGSAPLDLMENNREDLATQVKELKIGKLTGVTDRNGTDMMIAWE
eukprot:1560201-Prorocentrum_lima.AAC.1